MFAASLKCGRLEGTPQNPKWKSDGSRQTEARLEIPPIKGSLLEIYSQVWVVYRVVHDLDNQKSVVLLVKPGMPVQAPIPTRKKKKGWFR